MTKVIDISKEIYKKSRDSERKRAEEALASKAPTPDQQNTRYVHSADDYYTLRESLNGGDGSDSDSHLAGQMLGCNETLVSDGEQCDSETAEQVDPIIDLHMTRWSQMTMEEKEARLAERDAIIDGKMDVEGSMVSSSSGAGMYLRAESPTCVLMRLDLPKHLRYLDESPYDLTAQFRTELKEKAIKRANYLRKIEEEDTDPFVQVTQAEWLAMEEQAKELLIAIKNRLLIHEEKIRGLTRIEYLEYMVLLDDQPTNENIQRRKKLIKKAFEEPLENDSEDDNLNRQHYESSLVQEDSRSNLYRVRVRVMQWVSSFTRVCFIEKVSTE